MIRYIFSRLVSRITLLLLALMLLMPQGVYAQGNLPKAVCPLINLLRGQDADEISGYSIGMRRALAKQFGVRPVDMNRAINYLVNQGIFTASVQGTTITPPEASQMITRDQPIDLYFRDNPDICPPPGAPAADPQLAPVPAPAIDPSEIVVQQGKLIYVGGDFAEEAETGFQPNGNTLLIAVGVAVLLGLLSMLLRMRRRPPSDPLPSR